MKINYCLPIIKENKKEILDIINSNQDEYQYFEIWLDYVSDLNADFLSKLNKLLGKKLILLFRRKSLDQIKLSLKKRFEIMSLLSNSDAYLDLDISQKEEIGFTIKNNPDLKTIISYHNYNETPNTKKLEEIIAIIKEYKPNILKLSTFCNDENDALRLLELERSLKEQNIKHIILGMGKKGMITRIFGTLWGNEMIFAPIKKSESSAPEQLTKEELEKIFSLILNT